MPSLRRPVARAYGWFRTVLSLAALIVVSRSGRPAVEIWVGDSHAMWCNRNPTVARISRAPTGAFVWHLGPRLMWSVARDGFPRAVELLFRVLGRWARADVVPVFVLGEIDVRAHLAGRDTDVRFVERYAERVHDLVRHLKRPLAVLMVPPPPSDETPLSDLPVRGSTAERLAAFQQLRGCLARAAGADPALLLLDCTDVFLGERGLSASYSDDAIHLNPRGAAVIHDELSDVLRR